MNSLKCLDLITNVLGDNLLGVYLYAYADFIKAMHQDLERLAADIQDDTRNMLLTLARI